MNVSRYSYLRPAGSDINLLLMSFLAAGTEADTFGKVFFLRLQIPCCNPQLDLVLKMFVLSYQYFLLQLSLIFWPQCSQCPLDNTGFGQFNELVTDIHLDDFNLDSSLLDIFHLDFECL